MSSSHPLTRVSTAPRPLGVWIFTAYAAVMNGGVSGAAILYINSFPDIRESLVIGRQAGACPTSLSVE